MAIIYQKRSPVSGLLKGCLRTLPPMSVFSTFLCFSIFSRTLQDFGDGGAFPEIHLAQYPMNLGKPAESEAKTKSNALAVQLDATGKVKYDLIARQGHGKVDRSIRPLTWWPCLLLFLCHNLCDFVIRSWDSEVDSLIANHYRRRL